MEYIEGMGKPLKYYDVAVVFEEFPDEITLAVNISGCPCHCDNCSEPWLRPYVGTVLTNEEIDKLVESHPGITVFGLMGGDSNYKDCRRIAEYIHLHYPNLKVGMYSGRDFMSTDILNSFDLYKIGRWIDPYQFGDASEWHKHNCGVLQFPYSNQLLFEKVTNAVTGDTFWNNVTYKFRKEIVNDPTRYVIVNSKEDD